MNIQKIHAQMKYCKEILELLTYHWKSLLDTETYYLFGAEQQQMYKLFFANKFKLQDYYKNKRCLYKGVEYFVVSIIMLQTETIFEIGNLDYITSDKKDFISIIRTDFSELTFIGDTDE